MKLLRRNDKSNNNRGNLSHSEEILHLKAIALMEELEKTRRQREKVIRDRSSNERQRPLDPKRLLCFNGKSKKEKDEDDAVHAKPHKEISPWISGKSKTATTYVSKGRELSARDERRNNGDIADICNELCQDYYEIRKKLRNRPVVLASKKVQTMDSTSVSNSTLSSFDAPIRKFHDDHRKKKKNPRERKDLHYSNENRELHRQQPSLLDDNGSVHHNQKNKAKGKKSKQKQSKSNSFTSWISDGNKNSSHKSKTNKQKNKKSKNKNSISRKPNNNRPNIVWEDSPEMKGSGSTAYTVPVSFVEKKSNRSKMQPDLSMISTLTSSSYTTCDESRVILSPRGGDDKMERQFNPSEEIVDTDMGLVCAPIGFTATQQQSRLHRNPSVAGVALANLGTIAEGGAYASPSVSLSSSFSSYSSSSSGGDSGSYYNDSQSDGEEYDPSVVYGHDYAVRAIKTTPKIRAKKTTVNGGCTIGGGEMWNMFEEDSNSIVASDSFMDYDRRDDYSR